MLTFFQTTCWFSAKFFSNQILGKAFSFWHQHFSYDLLTVGSDMGQMGDWGRTHPAGCLLRLLKNISLSVLKLRASVHSSGQAALAEPMWSRVAWETPCPTQAVIQTLCAELRGIFFIDIFRFSLIFSHRLLSLVFPYTSLLC